MKVTRFAIEGKWFGVNAGDLAVDLVVFPESGPEDERVLTTVLTRGDLLKVIDEIYKELQDLKFKVEYGSSEKIWDSINGEEDNF